MFLSLSQVSRPKAAGIGVADRPLWLSVALTIATEKRAGIQDFVSSLADFTGTNYWANSGSLRRARP